MRALPLGYPRGGGVVIYYTAIRRRYIKVMGGVLLPYRLLLLTESKLILLIAVGALAVLPTVVG